jgi:hypothetical protein
MAQGERVSEDHPGDAPEPTLDEVRQRLSEIQEQRRTRIRWRMSRHTAELALRALEDVRPDRRQSSKSRRRKRRKRLL